jgi:uncharacterized protein
MKRLKGMFATILTLLIILQLTVVGFAATIPSATSNFYVNDFADVFTSEEEQKLMEKAVSLADNYNGIQVVITTVKSLEGDDIESYAYNMYNKYGIGKDDMGVLILMSTGDRKSRVEVGKNMEAYINDAKAGRLMDKYAIPYLKENKFNEGLINLQEKLINEIITMVKSETNTESSALVSGQTSSENKSKSKVDPSAIAFCFVIALVIGGAVAFIVYCVNKSKRTKQTIEELKNELEETQNSLEEQKRQNTLTIQNAREKAWQKEQEYQENLSEQEISIKQEYTKKIESLKTKNKRTETLLEETVKIRENLSSELSTLKDRHSRIVTMYPSIDEEVDKMIEEETRQKDIAAANEVDEAISKVINRKPDKDNVCSFEKVISAYSSLTETQKSYSFGNMKKVRDLYEQSVVLKEEYEKKLQEEENKKEASEVTKIITGILAAITVGKAANLPKLREATNAYGRLSSGALKYFDNSLIEKLKKRLSEADADFAREEKIKALKEAASDAEQKIKRKISYCYGKASDLSDLEEAMRIYERLSYDEQKYFDDSILRKLKNLIEDAERDKRRKEDEERRRREEDDDDDFFGGSSNFGGSFGGSSRIGGSFGGSGFSGFGGRSGGGGASRGF